MSEWIKVTDRLPGAGVIVLAYYRNALGKPRVIRASYAPENTVECPYAGEWDAPATTWDEETQAYYLEEGWYEEFDNWDDYSSVKVYDGNRITHWMRLPERPGDE